MTQKLNIKYKIQGKVNGKESVWRGILYGGTLSVGNLIKKRALHLAVLYIIRKNFRIIGQVRSSFHLDVLESVYIKTQNPVLYRQKEFVFSLKLFY